MLYGDLNVNDIQKRWDIYKHRADSLCWNTETKHNIVMQVFSNKNYN